MRHLIILVLSLCLFTACSSDTPSTDSDGIENRGGGIGEWYKALPREQWSQYPRIDTTEDWFEIYQIQPHIYAIYEPGQFEEVISFLIVGKRSAMLFDTGLGVGNMLSAVRGITNSPIVVLNSHGHYDHIGGNHQFDNIWGLNHPFSRERSKGVDAKDVAEYVSPAWLARDTPAGFDPQKYRIEPYEFSRWVRDGEVIDLGGVSLEVMLTPGHAPDSICLLDRDNRLLFTGDTFYLAPLYTHSETGDFEAYRASAARLAELESEVDWLLTSHNVPQTNSGYLGAMHRAFEAISNNELEFELSDGARQYRFDGFSILTQDPP